MLDFKMKKIIISIISILLTFFICWVLVAFEFSNSSHPKLWEQYNEAKNLNKSQTHQNSKDTIFENWNTFFNESHKLKWEWILTNQEIPIQAIINYDTLIETSFDHQKTIIYSTYLTYWKNQFSSETDNYRFTINDSSHINLVISFYPNSNFNAQKYVCFLDTIKTSQNEIPCGNYDFEEARRNFENGNIDISNAIKILNNWKKVK